MGELPHLGWIRNQARPVIESLAIMLLEILTALFHLDQHDGFPDEVGERRAAAILIGFAHAEFRLSAAVE